MPSDICFNCGTLSKFLAAYPELETSVKANEEATGLNITGSTKFKKTFTRNRRERKLSNRANNFLTKTNALTWQSNLDGGLRDIKLRDIGLLNASELLARYGTESQESFGIEDEDIKIPDDAWRDSDQEESAPLDEDLNLHYLGHNLMEELDMAADHQSMTEIEEDAKAENAEDEDEWGSDADDEDSECGDAQGSDGDFSLSQKLFEMARSCTTLQWEPSLPVERISRKAQALYNDLCGWNFTGATSCAISGATLVEDDELAPLASARKFSFDYGCESFTSAPRSSFDDGYGLDRLFLDSMDWDGDSSCSSSASVRNQLVECRHMVGGKVYQWDIFL